jgi:translation initiation factor 3 subunit E
VLYNYGQFQFTCGNYSVAADYLYHFRVLSTDADLLTSAHWGKLASDILRGEWAIALEELNTLRDAIDARPTPLIAPAAGSAAAAHAASQGPLSQLHSRSWLLHWALFVYFNHEEGRTLLLETFLAPAYLNTIQTSCPWILRYIATAAVLARKAATGTAGSSGRVRHALKEVVKLITLEGYQYSDPITEFLRELYVEFDFERAQKELAKAEAVIENDFFLGEFKDEFLDNARYLVTEAYCRIHQKIDIGYELTMFLLNRTMLMLLQRPLGAPEPLAGRGREVGCQPHSRDTHGCRREDRPGEGISGAYNQHSKY